MKRVDLARRLLLTPSGVTRVLEGLEQAGLVERATCPTDLRVTYAQLTAAGRATHEAASWNHEGPIRSLMEEHLSPSEIERLADLLGKLPGVVDSDDDCAWPARRARTALTTPGSQARTAEATASRSVFRP